MMLKDLDAGLVHVWEGLRPITKKMLVGVLQSSGIPQNSPPLKFEYDAHADWELSRLLSALDGRKKPKDIEAEKEVSKLAETCACILEAQSGSAEVFIQLAARAIKQHDYRKLDQLADHLYERYSGGEIAEIVRQTEYPQIRAIAYETLAMLSVQTLLPLLDDPLYAEIAIGALELKAFEYDSEDARDILDQIEEETNRQDPGN